MDFPQVSQGVLYRLPGKAARVSLHPCARHLCPKGFRGNGHNNTVSGLRQPMKSTPTHTKCPSQIVPRPVWELHSFPGVSKLGGSMQQAICGLLMMATGNHLLLPQALMLIRQLFDDWGGRWWQCTGKSVKSSFLLRHSSLVAV